MEDCWCLISGGFCSHYGDDCEDHPTCNGIYSDDDEEEGVK